MATNESYFSTHYGTIYPRRKRRKRNERDPKDKGLTRNNQYNL